MKIDHAEVGVLCSFIIGLPLILLLLAFAGYGHAEEAQQVAGSRYLVLSTVLEDVEIAREVETIKKAGPVHTSIGRLFVTDNQYEQVLFLYVRDSGFQHRIAYFKTKKAQIPIVLIVLPGGLIDVKLAELFSEIKIKGKKK